MDDSDDARYTEDVQTPEGESTPSRQRTTLDADVSQAEDDLVGAVDAVAAAEAQAPGGPGHPRESHEAARPVEEAGGGIAQGAGEAEGELVEHAAHSEAESTPAPPPARGDEDRLAHIASDVEAQEFLPESSVERVQTGSGDPDAGAPPELRRDFGEARVDEDPAPVAESSAGESDPEGGEGPAARLKEGAQGLAGEAAREAQRAGVPFSSEDGSLRVRVAKSLSIARVALGVGYLGIPQLAGPTWIGRAASRDGARIITAGLGARDIALGLGALTTLKNDEASRLWLRGQFLADLSDFLSTLARGRGVAPGPRLSGLLVTGGATAMAAYSAFAKDG